MQNIEEEKNIYIYKSQNLFKFVLVLLSASVERVGVSRIRDLKKIQYNFFFYNFFLILTKTLYNFTLNNYNIGLHEKTTFGNEFGPGALPQLQNS